MPEPVNSNASAAVDGRLGRWLHRLWPSSCLVCREAAAADLDLCPACIASLPWIRSACSRCAIPLPDVAHATTRAPVGAHPGATGLIGEPHRADLPVGAHPGATGLTGEARRARVRSYIGCNDPIDSLVCGACLQNPPSLSAAFAACLYGFPVDRLLPRFKFHGDLAAGRALAQLMGDAFADAPRPDAIVPVPLHRARLRQRGYDQALELARPLARRLAIPLRLDLLRRERHTQPQSRLDAAQRRRNVRRAFVVDTHVALPTHVVLVDDVMTTGATLHAAAVALRRAGVIRIDAWVCARVP